MKVLHVEGGAELYGGAQQVLYLLEGLAGCGVDSHLACRPGCALARHAAAFAQVHEIPMGGDLDVGIIARLGRVIRTAQPDLVHLHSRIGADVMGAIAARRAGIPVVHTRRVDNPEPRWLAAAKYGLHDRVIAISEGIARVLRATGMAEAKLRVVRSAVDARPYTGGCDGATLAGVLGGLDAAAPGPDRGPSAGSPSGSPSGAPSGSGRGPAPGPVIAVVAQLIERKGHRFLLQALPDILAALPDVQVLFFGKGPLAGPLQERIDRDGLAAHVRLMGYREDLPRLLPCMDLLVHPATLEGLGVSLLQASAAGVPIIASRVGGIPEAVHDGENGRLVPAGDVAALRAAILALLANAGLRRRMGAAGRALVAREFSVARMVAGNLAVYRELLAGAAPATSVAGA
ncbi:glycosyltransferase [uncultured Thiohalocapsa sp.]|uniref:glycosyltransferase n=1 Tax=uncultured Thiohalocapsa sp. TaxID=768990 RepID=UPI0025E50C28|nr:glycosyltransferase [uncultured Thiohalocapsa sp.]